MPTSMNSEIPLLPSIPERLRIAASAGNLVPFVGAGVSAIGGIPNWAAFATSALHHFVGRGKITPAQFDQLSHLSPRVKLAIATALEKEHNISIDFSALLRPPTGLKKEAGDKVYAGLAKLGSTFVTTNYDEWLDTMPAPMKLGEQTSATTASNREVVYRLTDLNLEMLSTPNAVLHIHGSVRDRASMVLTTSDYLDRYRGHRIGGEGRENPFLTVLETLFKQKCVLFVGYGLEELEVLEYVVQKSRHSPKTEGLGSSHFILQGFFSHQVELKRSLESYYLNECGITLLPYSRDEKDWDQLIDVIESFSMQIPASSPLGLQERMEMQGLLDD